MVPIGRFGAPHGVRGEIKFKPYDGIEEFIWDKVPLGEILLPVIPETIKEVRMEERLVIVHLLEGLLGEE